ncbi:MAG: energy transducer TonB [Bacteroidetes bacterium]|nr:energy transducer TonB [Bacteroidota bacterium]
MKTTRLIICILILSISAGKLYSQDRVKAGFGVTVVQSQPQFPGGEDSLISFLKNNLRYPQEAKLAWIQGRVFVGFLIDYTGKIKDIKVLSGVNQQLDDEALRVVHMMPEWIPGKIGETNVDTRYILPIEFIMPKRNKE